MHAFPKEFTASLEGQLGTAETQALLDALNGTPLVSVRFNPYKLSEKPAGRQIPWCRYGFMLDERPQFTLDPSFHGGAYYVQEAGSMFIEHLYRSVIGESDGLRILDLCAAPGGKTTLLSTIAGLESVVVANEVIRQRAMTLADNVRKWGLANVVVTNNDPTHFDGFREYFDLILVDAPCSGEGMFRKSPEAREQWSPDNVKLCAQRQRRILADIWGSLKPGGVLIYSTCTFNRTENEDNVTWLASEYNCQAIDVDIEEQWGIEKGYVTSGHNGSEKINTFRLYPHRVESEGFFVAILRKGDNKVRTKTPKPRRAVFSELSRQSVKAVSQWVTQPEYMHFAAIEDNIYGYYISVYNTVKTLSGSLSVVYSGVLAGQLFKDNKLRPEHPLALFHDLKRNYMPHTCLETEDALNYLRKQNVDPLLLSEGINLVSFKNLPIGWIKRIGARSNNMYPKELRIQNL